MSWFKKIETLFRNVSTPGMEYTKLDHLSRISAVMYFGTCNSPVRTLGTCNSPVRTLLNIMFTEMYTGILEYTQPRSPEEEVKNISRFYSIWGKKLDQEDVKKGGG